MNQCEAYQANLSAALDHELHGDELLDTLAHLVECASCRTFFQQSRILESLFQTGREYPGIEAPEDRMWQSIEKRSGLKRTLVVRLRESAHPVWAVAAMLLLAVGLWAGGGFKIPGLHTKQEVIELRLGEDRGKMTESRFIELTAELLRSDRRFHRKMLAVMQQVNQGEMILEGSQDFNRDSKELDKAESSTLTPSERNANERSASPVEISFW